MESSIACRDRWLSKAQAIQRCKSGHASSLAVWIESKSPRVGGRKTRRGVTMGIKWRIERLRCNCSGLMKAEMVFARAQRQEFTLHAPPGSSRFGAQLDGK